jgi:hypothetical protein
MGLYSGGSREVVCDFVCIPSNLTMMLIRTVVYTSRKTVLRPSSGPSLQLTFFIATEVTGIFRVNGSARRMRELQAAFETPPRVRFAIIQCFDPCLARSQYGKSMDWSKETYTTHDVASVFRRYLTQMPVSNSHCFAGVRSLTCPK